MDSEWKAPEHSGVESYATNPGHVDEASGNLRGPRHVEQAKEGAPRRPVAPAPAVPIVNGRPLGADAVPQIPLGLFASTMLKDLEGKK
jgi:hypothetical protein